MIWLTANCIRHYFAYTKGFIKDNFAVIGTARREWSDVHFREVVLDSIKDLIEDKEDAISFAAHFYYIAHNVNDAEHYIKLKDLSNHRMPSIHCQGTAFFTWRCLGVFRHHFRKTEEQKLLTEDGFNRLIIKKTFRAGFRICGCIEHEVAQVVWWKSNLPYRSLFG